jgi:SAM-dependent methyltransferase
VIGSDLLHELARLPADARDAAIERQLGLDERVSAAPPGDELVGYHASGVAAIVRFLREVRLGPSDVFVDLGAGLGKVVMLVALLTPARARGIELQPGLAERARANAARLGLGIDIVAGDARSASLDDGTVFYLYAPFTGAVLASVLERLHSVARQRAIAVGALGVDLDAPWLARRAVDSFWLSVYDSVVPGVPARVEADGAALDAAIALER